jgi:hypothetical protein
VSLCFQVFQVSVKTKPVTFATGFVILISCYFLQLSGQVQFGSPGWQSGVHGQLTQSFVLLQSLFFFVVVVANTTVPATNRIATILNITFFIYLYI